MTHEYDSLNSPQFIHDIGAAISQWDPIFRRFVQNPDHTQEEFNGYYGEGKILRQLGKVTHPHWEQPSWQTFNSLAKRTAEGCEC